METTTEETPEEHLEFLQALIELHQFVGIPMPGAIPPLAMVVDANTALRAISSKAKRKSLEQLTTIEQSVRAQQLLAFAPPALLAETNDDYLKRFETHEAPLGRLRSARELFLKNIVIVNAPRPKKPSAALLALEEIDPKDAPYASLFEHLQPDAILSKDKHFVRAGYPTIGTMDKDVVCLLRDYAFSMTTEAMARVAVGGGTVLTIETIRGIVGLLRKAPGWVQLLLGITSVGLAAHPKSRAAIAQACRDFADGVGPMLKEAMDALNSAREERTEIEGEIGRLLESILERRQKRPIIEHAFLVLAASPEPLAPRELAARVRTAGSAGRPSEIARQLQPLLCADRRFLGDGDGKWSVRIRRGA